ncbi:pyridoxamine 5'-phosphate oxidase family protein [Panacibacter sp. DH6]|uniref:Pyridoxamine 5'-phosphate oxidase family protein n=1 Tax=Panacibacter microcysteis TaxID=2793269 RepID=A0A931E959_9BACT|nr:pyridoxamine 5'-phosphate oxidase family protein [Panacibacter microcysteis]MBG9377449.1 pyridoxamine 5'-phosphate oxidase family protein [Panacibacter microcysteis]
MGKFHSAMTNAHIDFIRQQKMFFTATAPLSATGHINLSPKGLDSFRVLSPTKVIYMDIVGSGNETSAHILENQRITFMFCAFEGAPNILRLYGKGHTVTDTHADWQQYASLFQLPLAVRQFIVADIHKVQTSCGFSVPYYDYAGERDHAEKWAAKKGIDGLQDYMQEKNMVSMDGLPTALAIAHK